MSAKDFQVITKLGEGAYSNVYKVKRTSDSQEYAMKKVKLGSLSEKEKENALNEVRILASIKSPYVVGYKEAFFDDDSMTLCIIMEYLSGGDMYHKITQHKKEKTYMPEPDIWKHAIQMILGLKSLHDLKIFHRDLKSANIFLSKDSECAKLGDLNVSKVAKNNLAHTQTGTPYYASPEVWRDQPYNLKSDIWSLGCVLYEMCALHPPFRANDMKGLYQRVQKGNFERIPSHYSPDLHNLISMCLQVAASARPNCDQLLAHPLVTKHGKNIMKNPIPPPESNELLSTIRIPRNIKSLAKHLPKANYAHDLSHSVDMHDEKPLKDGDISRETQKGLNKRAVSQNAPVSRGRVSVQKPVSREVRVNQVQGVSPVPPKESERDYLDRMQNEYIERAKVIRANIDKLPDIAKVRPRASTNQSGGGYVPVLPDYNEYKSKNNDGKYSKFEEKSEEVYKNYVENVEKRRILEPKRASEVYIGQRKVEAGYIDKVVPQVPMQREESDSNIYKGKMYHILNKYDANRHKENRYLNDKNLSRVSSENMSTIEKRADYLLNKYRLGEGMSYRSNNVELYQAGNKSSVRSDSKNDILDYLEQYNNMYNLRKTPNQMVASSRGREGQVPYDIRNYNSQPTGVQEKKRYYY